MNSIWTHGVWTVTPAAMAARLGADVLGPGLARHAESHPCVGDVRGIGGAVDS